MPASNTQSSERRIATNATPSPRFRCRPALCDPAYSSISAWCRSIRLAGDGRFRLDVEEGSEDLGRRGSRRDAAVAAVLDHGADDEPGRVGRPIPAPPGLVLVADVARQGHDLLGRAGLAGDRDGEGAENGVRRPERQPFGTSYPVF